MGWVQLSSLVRSKKTLNCVHHWSQRQSQDIQTVCAISPNGEARTFEPHAPSVLKIFGQKSTQVGFNYPPRLGPKRHRTACAISPKGEGRTHRLCEPLVPKAKLGYSVCVTMYWSFVYFPAGGSYKMVTRTLPIYPCQYVTMRHTNNDVCVFVCILF